jgi:hypothetical protein
LPDASFAIAVVVDGAGAVAVTVTDTEGATQAELANQVRLIVRTAYRQAVSDGEAPPWRIQRWRGEK